MRASLPTLSALLLTLPTACSSEAGRSPAVAVESSQPDLGSGSEAPDDEVDGASASDAEASQPDPGEGGGASSSQEGAPNPTGLSEGDGNDGSSGGGADVEPGDPESDAPGDDDPSSADEPPEEGDPGSPLDACPAGPFAASPLEGASEPEAVCTGMGFTEGAVWFAERSTLYFSDITASTILTYSPGGACEPFVQNAGTNGLVIGLDGHLLGARHGDQTLTRFDLETGEPTVFLADADGVPFIAPNDIVVRSDGNLYFTDPDYGLGGAGGSDAPPRAYRLDPDGELSVIDEGGNSNGIVLSPDESRLYLSHLGGGPSNIVAFELDDSGAPGDALPFANVGSDGMGMDCAGNLYATQNGVRIFNPEGEEIGRINAPNAANVAFGGPARSTLYVTAGGTLFAVELAIPGLPY